MVLTYFPQSHISTFQKSTAYPADLLCKKEGFCVLVLYKEWEFDLIPENQNLSPELASLRHESSPS